MDCKSLKNEDALTIKDIIIRYASDEHFERNTFFYCPDYDKGVGFRIKITKISLDWDYNKHKIYYEIVDEHQKYLESNDHATILTDDLLYDDAKINVIECESRYYVNFGDGITSHSAGFKRLKEFMKGDIAAAKTMLGYPGIIYDISVLSKGGKKSRKNKNKKTKRRQKKRTYKKK